MVGKTTQQHHHHHHAASSSSLAPEELNLLHKARGSPDGGGGGGGGGRSRGAAMLGRQWKCMLLGYLGGLGLGLGIGRTRRPRCVVCFQVQQVAGLPPAAEGRGVVVGWRSKGRDGERTAPARVARGAAAFDDVFLQHFSAGGATLRGFTVWAALVDDPAAAARSGCGDEHLGAFPVDLTEAAAAAAEECCSPMLGGRALSFPLGGAAAGAVLTASVYCRVMDQQEEIHAANGKKNKGKSSYASCMPDLSCLRNRPTAAAMAASGSTRRATSLRSERGGFITIENSMAEMDVDGGDVAGVEDDEGFITMEKGTISSRSRRAPPSTSLLLAAPLGGVVDEYGMPEEDEKPCLFMELSGDAAATVEDEFLAMLEGNRCWMEARSKEIEKGLDVGLDLESLIKDAEMELARAEQAWKSKVGAAVVEEEEYEELVRRWSARDLVTPPSSNSACSWTFGFGSPI